MDEYPRPLTAHEIRKLTDRTGPCAEQSMTAQFRRLVAAGHPPESLEVFISVYRVDRPYWAMTEDLCLPAVLGPQLITRHVRFALRPRPPNSDDRLSED